MNTADSSDPAYAAVPAYVPAKTLCWGAILAGLIATLSIQIVLMMLGSGLGLAMYNPETNDNPVGDLTTGAAVIEGVSAVISLWLGGWIAGRFTGRAGRKTGTLHGFMVWCLATVTAILAVTVGAGWALGNLSKIVGGGLSAVGKPIAAAASGAADLAKDAADRNKGMVSSFIDEAVSARAQGKTETDAIRARRDLGRALSRLVAGGDTTAEANKQAIVDVLTRDLGVPDADARRMADDWTASVQKLRSQLDEMKQKAETRAREAAEKSSKALSIMSLGSFVAFMIGAIFAAWGGRHGGATAYRRSEGNEVGVE